MRAAAGCLEYDVLLLWGHWWDSRHAEGATPILNVKRELPTSAAAVKGQAVPVQPKVAPSVAVDGRPPASGQAGFLAPKVPPPKAKEILQTPMKTQPQKEESPSKDVSMSPGPEMANMTTAPKAPSPSENVPMTTAPKAPSPSKDVPMTTAPKAPSPSKDVPMTPGPKVTSPPKEVPTTTAQTPAPVSGGNQLAMARTPGATPIKSPDYKKARRCRLMSLFVLEKQQDPSRSMRRVVFEGYYGMRKQDVLWCELAEIEEAMPMVKWMASALPVNSSGTVAIEDCRAELLVDMSGLPSRLECINAAWLKSAEWAQLRQKSVTTLATIHSQAENMLLKLNSAFQKGESSQEQLLRRTAATEQWRRIKTSEVQQSLDKAEIAALVAIDQSFEHIMHMWEMFCDKAEKGLVEEMPGSEDMTDQLIMDELEQAMGSLGFEEAWPGSGFLLSCIIFLDCDYIILPYIRFQLRVGAPSIPIHRTG
ncbi:unnamed protein product [Symbiodinium microadriaticum]|nr:unnamed protein product [Symbiodinium microadriaticum]CAE7921534.1 unnamed protein product [Symbiodinium sp. KB8]